MNAGGQLKRHENTGALPAPGARKKTRYESRSTGSNEGQGRPVDQQTLTSAIASTSVVDHRSPLSGAYPPQMTPSFDRADWSSIVDPAQTYDRNYPAMPPEAGPGRGLTLSRQVRGRGTGPAPMGRGDHTRMPPPGMQQLHPRPGQPRMRYVNQGLSGRQMDPFQGQSGLRQPGPVQQLQNPHGSQYPHGQQQLVPVQVATPQQQVIQVPDGSVSSALPPPVAPMTSNIPKDAIKVKSPSVLYFEKTEKMSSEIQSTAWNVWVDAQRAEITRHANIMATMTHGTIHGIQRAEVKRITDEAQVSVEGDRTKAMASEKAAALSVKVLRMQMADLTLVNEQMNASFLDVFGVFMKDWDKSEEGALKLLKDKRAAEGRPPL